MLRGDMKITEEDISRICHNDHRLLNLKRGDFTYKLWDHMTDEEKEPRRIGTLYLLCSKDATAEDRHNLWISTKLNQGWVPGPVKNPVIKTHPSLVPWEFLPISERMKSVMFIEKVRALEHYLQRTFFSLPSNVCMQAGC